MSRFFSLPRLSAMILKEFIQMKRDKATFAMIIGIPLIQLLLFGYAINTNPKHLPAAIVSADHSIFTRTFITGMENTDYFRMVNVMSDEQQAQTLLAAGKVQFVLTIPPDFSRDLVRGERPQLLLTADATDPSAIGKAVSAVEVLANQIFDPDLVGNLASLKAKPGPIDLVVHEKYNPEAITQYNIVPGLMGVVLTMTMVIITALVITRERERGTMENLLATPVRPLEVMFGKVLPYVAVGYLQMTVILIAAEVLFNVPMQGSYVLLYILGLPFIAANLAVGIMFSTIAKNQLQAVQMAFFFFLPSILLSGFMFPFRGMPAWAQWLGSILPLTHFICIIRGIMLKGNGISLSLQSTWPMLLFCNYSLRSRERPYLG